MQAEEVGQRADAWADAIKKIVKALTAVAVAVGGAITAMIMWLPSSDPTPPLLPPSNGVIENSGHPGGSYSPISGTAGTAGTVPAECSQLYNALDHTWTEQQWSVWEDLKRNMSC